MTRSAHDTHAFDLALDAAPENLLIVRQALDGLAESMAVEEGRREDLKLAVTEACTNVIKYAYSGETGAMRLAVDTNGSKLRVTVTDDGRWKEPGSPGAPPEPGHGLAVIEAVCEDVEIETGATGTAVTMTFALSSPIAE